MKAGTDRVLTNNRFLSITDICLLPLYIGLARSAPNMRTIDGGAQRESVYVPEVLVESCIDSCTRTTELIFKS